MNRKRGVATLLKKDICDKTEEIYKENEGRILAIKITNKHEKKTICNIHAPNNEEQRRKLFND